MSFGHGMTCESPDNQRIACLCYMIDTYANFLKNTPYLLPNSTNGCSLFEKNDAELFLGMVRAGLKLMINDLSEVGQKTIHDYINNVIMDLRRNIDIKLLESDVLIGTKNPFNLYFSGRRIDNNYPLTQKETKSQIFRSISSKNASLFN